MRLFTLFICLLFSISCSDKKPAKENSVTTIEDNITNDSLNESEEPLFNIDNFQKLVEQYEDPNRTIWQNPSLIINKLGELKNKTVADIGAGSGYFTFRIAAQGAHVIAIDVDEKFIDYIENRKSELSDVLPSSKVETRLSTEDDPMLKPKEVDLALLVNTYYFIEERSLFLKKIAEGLNEEGKIVIVDYQMGEMPVGPPEEYRVPLENTIDEINKAGLEILEVDSKSLNYQYIITIKQK